MKSSNQLILKQQIQGKEDQLLKHIEFATEYMLKQSQYRNLSPLYQEDTNIKQKMKINEVMNQLNSMSYEDNIYEAKQKLMMSKLKSKQMLSKSKLSKLSPIRKTPQKIRNNPAQFIPFQQLPQKKSINQKSKEKSITKTSFKSTYSPAKKYSTSLSTALTPNRLILQPQIVQKQQQCLKHMQFATQYMLKQSEYQLLNPLHQSNLGLQQMTNDSNLMSQLQQFSFIKKQPLNVKKSILQKSALKQRIKANQVKPVQKEIIIQPNSQQLLDSSVIKRIETYVQSQDQQVELKQTLSQLSYLKSQSDQSKSNQSRTIRTKLQKPKQLKSKGNPPEKQIKIVNPLIIEPHCFKKKSASNSQPQTLLSSVILKKQQPISIPISNSKVDNDSQDSFQNMSFTNQNDSEVRAEFQQSLDQKDKSYHSVVIEQKKKKLNNISQHPSQIEQTLLDINRRNLSDQVLVELGLKDQTGNINNRKGNFSKFKEQNGSSKLKLGEKSEDISQNIPILTRQTSPTQISNYLMKLQSFQMQQQMLLKKISKIWSQQLQCVKKLKSTNWRDLNLPKPVYKEKLFNYAKPIE